MDARGGDPIELIPPDANQQYPTGWSPDGRNIVYMTTTPGSSWDLRMVEATAGATPTDLVATAKWNGVGRISPDGRWLVHSTMSTGSANVWVRALDGEGPGDQVSSDGAFNAEWLDNDTLVYISDDRIMSLDLEFREDRVFPGRKVELLSSEHDLDEFSVHPDGRILIIRQTVESNAQRGRVLVGALQGPE